MKINLCFISGKMKDAPYYATQHSAGLDLKACIEGPVILESGQRYKFPTGISVAIPQGFVGKICSRSGLAWKQGVIVLNSPGIIDSDYRDELQVILINHGRESAVIEPMQRIAQIVFQAYQHIEWNIVACLEESHTDRQGGFGSTGAL